MELSAKYNINVKIPFKHSELLGVMDTTENLRNILALTSKEMNSLRERLDIALMISIKSTMAVQKIYKTCLLTTLSVICI